MVQITATYHPEAFDAADLASAKAIILTPDGVNTTEDRWRKETPYLIDLMVPLGVTSKSIVLDYGCGVGRLSKAMIEKYGCFVVGADISTSMRALAASYVSSPRFLACDPSCLSQIGIEFDAAISVWALQHCLDPASDISAISRSLKWGGGLFVVNERARFVPAKEVPWVDDGIDILSILDGELKCVQRGELDHTIVPSATNGAYWASYTSNGR